MAPQGNSSRKSWTDMIKHQKEQETLVGLTIPYEQGTSEKIRRIARPLGVRTVFSSRNALRSNLSKTKPPQNQTKNVIYHIPCTCGKAYIKETKMPLNVQIKEHRKHTTKGETTKSGLGEHAWKEHHNILWEDAKVLNTEIHW
ncbi:unnamed protein product [Brassicogethes aeneus]|uniref:C2H2-type domain-containing protein n=1 Tax=Brassicogethes aeneus TaxID=1431903 RepID=A0A9P0FJJ3_BRAAE|nr:unnamed protein product [Brassicogethes aeneus]